MSFGLKQQKDTNVNSEVTSSNNLTDNYIVRGDGGVKGVQTSGVLIDDSNNVSGIGTLGCGSITSSGSLSVGTAHYVNVTTVNTETYDLLTTDYILDITYTATGSATVTLPTLQSVKGRVIIIKDAGSNAGTNNITIQTEGVETIDGSATYVINTDNSSVSIHSTGTNWLTH